MLGTLNPSEEAQLRQTIEMFEVITQSQPNDYQSLEILKEAYLKLGMEKEVIQTSKRIAEAYVQLGQLSSAILEYETILQRHPEDPDALEAMMQIESKANSLAAPPQAEVEASPNKPATTFTTKKSILDRSNSSNACDDGRQTMFKIFVDGKYITAGDFEVCWQPPLLGERMLKPMEPFIHILSEKAIMPADKGLKLLSDRARMAYLSLEKYDIDIELARTFPADICRRWCVVPFDRMSKSVLVATANPFNRQATLELEQATKSRLIWYLAPPADLLKWLGKVFR